METCSGCGHEVSSAFAFCPRCGAPQGRQAQARPAAAEREADRRHVTVLFADLSGFTALAERLDPEDVRAFQNRLFEALAGAIGRYDGFVEKFVGDAVLAVFGAPVAHEDDPERACDAALEMLDRSAALSRQWEARLGQPVQLHVGVHTGPVVAGHLGGAAGAAYAVTGDTVNTTARLQAAAPPGSILVSEATHALVRYRFESAPAGELSLRGKREPVAVHRLIGARSERRSARGLGSLGLASPFVGHREELGRLHAAVDQVRRGEAHVVTLVGEAGIGKSRLIAQLIAGLGRDGDAGPITVRHAACSSLGEPTYGVFAALFREGHRLDAPDSLAVAQRYVLGLAGDSAPDIEPEQLRRQIVLAARALIERQLETAPLLVVVEDIHWADSASVDLLREIADQLADRSLMLLLSHRLDTASPPVVRATPSAIRVAPLSGDDMRTLVSELFSASPDVISHVADFVAMRAGGNPLFAEEIVRNLVSRGVLVRQGERWSCTAACDSIDVPPSLHGLLLSRVDRLPPEARRVLQEAAVVGAAFDAPLLRMVTSAPDGLPATLDRLVQADLVHPTDRRGADGRYTFTHGLLREVVYQNLLLSRRTEMHEQIGRALERTVGPRPERLSDLEALAHHWSLSPDRRRGARYLLAAGDRARAVYANDDAIRHYERALETLAACADDCEGEARSAREQLADVLALTGRPADALVHYEAVLKKIALAADATAAARLQRKIGGLHWDAGDRERAATCFAAGLERLGESGDPIERAQLFQELGRLAFRAGDNAAAIAWSERALAEAALDSHAVDADRAREASTMRAQAYNTLGVALARTGRGAEAVQQIERSIALAEAHQLLPAACRGYTNLGVLYSSLDPRRSIETCLRGLETAKKVGDLGFQSRLYANLAVAYCALTDRCEDEGREAAQAAIDLDRRLGLLDHLAVPLIVLGQIHQCHGEHREAFAMYEEALGVAEAVGEPQLLFPCYDGLATLYLDAGNQAMAEHYLTRAQEICARAGVEPDALMVLPFLC
jgi:adenylate cyclase